MEAVVDRILEHQGATITEKELHVILEIADYEILVNKINELVDSNILKPVKAARTNGRIPPLYNKYRIVRPKMDFSAAIEEIKLLHPRLNIAGYLANPSIYAKHRKELAGLSDYLWRQAELLTEPMSQNERSLSVWGREKLLREKAAVIEEILRFNKLTREFLNYYETPEPFIEYIHQRAKEMNVLVVENKDTWFSIRKVMLESGQSNFFGTTFNVLLYGEGRKISRKMGRLCEYDREILSGSQNRYFYFGDLDYEGIQIFLDVQTANKGVDIELFKEGYKLMLRLADGLDLPVSPDRRDKEVDLADFLRLFTQDEQERIISILANGRYIPQEIINYQIIKRTVKGQSGHV